MPKRHLPATGEAISTAKAPDAKLRRLEAEFHATRDREEKAVDRRQELEVKIDRMVGLMRKAERKVDRRTQEASRLFNKVMETRAKSLEGMLAKVRVRESWSGDDEQSERAVLKSLVKDLERMAR